MQELGIKPNQTLGKVNKKSVYETVNDILINELENGRIPWRKEWQGTYQGDEVGIFFNYRTKRPYKGVNPWVIGAKLKPHHCNWFLTKAQIEKAGGTINKGATQFMIVYNGKATKTITVDPTPEFPNGEVLSTFIRFLREYRVYNLADTDLDAWKKFEPTPKTEAEKIESCEKVYPNMPNKPVLKHGGDEAYYIPLRDRVQMPHLSDFKKPQNYYSTLFHELIHSTMHDSRLKRSAGIKGTKEYALEELVAEIGASYICAYTGIFFATQKNSAAYLRGWGSKLASEARENKNFFFKAASESQKAANYILSKLLKQSKRKQPKKALGSAYFNEQVLEYKTGKKIGQFIDLGFPSILLLNAGVPNAKILMSKKVIDKAIKKHRLNYKHFVDLDDRIKNPVAIVRSTHAGSIVVLVDLLDRNNKGVIVALELGVKTDQGNYINRVASVYGKDNQVLRHWLKKELIHLNPKKKAFVRAFSAPIAENLPKKALNGTTTTVAQPPANVNHTPDITKTQSVATKNNDGFTNAGDITSAGSETLPGDLGEMLGPIGKHYCAITLEADKGAGKSQMAYQFADVFAGMGYKVAIYSLEMLLTSPTVQAYRDKYIKPENLANVIITDKSTTAKKISSQAHLFDVAIIDSFNELEEYSQDQFGKLFKAHPEKRFLALFQSHSGDQIRGGIKPLSDAYINIYIHKVDNTFKNNYAECTKNRFGPTGPKYNIASKSITTDGHYPTTEELTK